MMTKSKSFPSRLALGCGAALLAVLTGCGQKTLPDGTALPTGGAARLRVVSAKKTEDSLEYRWQLFGEGLKKVTWSGLSQELSTPQEAPALLDLEMKVTRAETQRGRTGWKVQQKLAADSFTSEGSWTVGADKAASLDSVVEVLVTQDVALKMPVELTVATVLGRPLVLKVGNPPPKPKFTLPDTAKANRPDAGQTPR